MPPEQADSRRPHRTVSMHMTNIATANLPCAKHCYRDWEQTVNKTRCLLRGAHILERKTDRYDRVSYCAVFR